MEKDKPVLGLEIDGLVARKDGTSFNIDDFLDILDENGLHYAGSSRHVILDDNNEDNRFFRRRR